MRRASRIDRASRIGETYKIDKSRKTPASQSKCEVITVPPLGEYGEPDSPETSTGTVTGILQLRGSVADQDMTGVSLANTQEVVTLDSGGRGASWGIMSQTMPKTVIVPRFNLARPVTAQQWMTSVQPGDQTIVITSHHAMTPQTEPAELLKRHELGGVMADQVVTLAAQRPVHYVRNVLTVESDKGSAVSRFEYTVADGVVPWRIMLTQCWLQNVLSQSGLQNVNFVRRVTEED